MKQEIGKMDCRITIEQPTQSQGMNGEAIETWTTFATVWANKYEGGGREFEAARQLNPEITAQFQIRYLSGVTSAMRILCGGEYFEIVRPPEEVGRKERMNIWAKARR